MSELKSQARIRHPVWPVALISLGISLTVVWMGVLGYGIYKLIDLAI